MKVREMRLKAFGTEVLFSSIPRNCHFYGHLRGWRRYEQYVKTTYCAPLRKWYFYVYVPAIERQLCLDVWLRRG